MSLGDVYTITSAFGSEVSCRETNFMDLFDLLMFRFKKPQVIISLNIYLILLLEINPFTSSSPYCLSYILFMLFLRIWYWSHHQSPDLLVFFFISTTSLLDIVFSL